VWLYEKKFGKVKMENIAKYLEKFVEKIADILVEHFKDKLLGIVWYGSSVRGKFSRESDIDFILIFEKIDSLTKIYEELTKVTHKKILRTEEAKYLDRKGYLAYPSFYVMSLGEFKAHPPILLDPVVEGKILFEKNSIVSKEFERIKKRLKKLGAKRVRIFGDYCWILKPYMRGGEEINI